MSPTEERTLTGQRQPVHAESGKNQLTRKTKRKTKPKQKTKNKKVLFSIGIKNDLIFPKPKKDRIIPIDWNSKKDIVILGTDISVQRLYFILNEMLPREITIRIVEILNLMIKEEKSLKSNITQQIFKPIRYINSESNLRTRKLKNYSDDEEEEEYVLTKKERDREFKEWLEKDPNYEEDNYDLDEEWNQFIYSAD